MKKFRIFAIIVVSGLVLVGFWLLKNEYENRAAITEIRPVVAWIEDFYTLNARFPTKEEFYSQFPNLRYIQEYATLDVDDLPGSAQDFRLRYFVSRPTWSDAPGKPEYADLSGYKGTYLIDRCPRWHALGLYEGLDQGLVEDFVGPWPFTSVSPPGGLVISDLEAGEVSFDDSTDSDDRKILLSGLHKPRLFQKVSNKVSNNRTTHIIVTDGTDVISYEWSEFGPALLNPKKVGDVPASCPIGPSD